MWADGSIPLVQYQSDDSPYYVNVKLSAINAFQTSMQPGTFIVDDPTGVHSAQFALTDVVINTQFSQSSYKSFMDPTVTADSVQLQALGSVTFHPTNGAVVAASNQQHVISRFAQQDGAAPVPVSNVDGDDSGYNMFMSSVGQLNITLSQTQTLRFQAVKVPKKPTRLLPLSNPCCASPRIPPTPWPWSAPCRRWLTRNTNS